MAKGREECKGGKVRGLEGTGREDIKEISLGDNILY